MNTISRIIVLAVFIIVTVVAATAAGPDYTNIVAELISPAKLATLRERGANPRVQKYVYWLATAQAQGVKPAAVSQAAVEAAGYTNKLARKLTVNDMLRNLDIATKRGCLDEENLEKMRHGWAPTIRKGRYQGDQLSVDHIIPRSAIPGLDNVIANLELMPLRMGDVLTVRHGKSQHGITAPDGKYPILASGGEIGRTNAYIYDRPSVLIGRKGTIDSPQYVDSPFWTVDTLFFTEISSEAEAKFVFYKFTMIRWRTYNEASGVPSLNAKTIKSIAVTMPPLPEQTAIAEVLAEMDAELAALERRQEKTRALKQAMMQELLTGRTRLV